MTPPRQAALRLPPGQSHSLYLGAGSLLLVRAGSVDLQEPPRWISDQVLQLRLPLATGQSHALAESGWITLQAVGGAAEALIVAPRPAVSRWGVPLPLALRRLLASRRARAA